VRDLTEGGRARSLAGEAREGGGPPDLSDTRGSVETESRRKGSAIYQPGDSVSNGQSRKRRRKTERRASPARFTRSGAQASSVSQRRAGGAEEKKKRQAVINLSEQVGTGPVHVHSSAYGQEEVLSKRVPSGRGNIWQYFAFLSPRTCSSDARRKMLAQRGNHTLWVLNRKSIR